VKKWVYILIIFLFFFSFSFNSLDPDFGWHLKTGSLILARGIPKVDPFSYTMPTFPFVDHAWTMSVLISLLYPLIGKIGLSAVFSFLATAVIILIYPKKSKFSFFFLIAAAVMGSFVGIRAQVATWLMLAVFMRVITDKKLWSRLKFFTPLFFILWANIHGGFASGLLALTIIIFLRQIERKKSDINELFVVFASILGTLINPYGLGLWREVWSSISDSSLRWSIAEWQPFLFIFNLPTLAYISFSSFFVFKARKSLKLEEIIIFAVFLLQSLVSVRHTTLFVIVSFPIFIKSIEYVSLKISPTVSAGKRLEKVRKYLYWGVLVLFFIQMLLNFNGSFGLKEERFYPKNAIEFLKNNLPKGQIFSPYNWGGYLIWKFPEKKVFVDGRMPSWRRQIFPPNETASAFEEYRKILKGEVDYKVVFSKYQIDMVLLEKEKPRKALIVIPINPKKKEPEFNLLKKLKEDGWKEVYTDDLAVILQRTGK
jgi:hypothetical protein